MRVFLGITGASGAPYAARLVRALTAADVELGICASSAGIEVLATELYGNPRLSRDETLTRVLEHAQGGNVTVYEPNDWKSPYASGSAKVDAYVICPCSMGTLGTIASGAMSNLIHRAASVALKEERRLVVMPRETPLSLIHLRNMLTVKEAGATVLFLAPGFYHGAETVDDLVDFIVARALDQLGLEVEHVKRWGKASEVSVNYESGQLAPDNVRRMFDRIAPVYDAMNRTMTAGLDRRWRRLTAEAVVRPGDEVLDACCGTGDLAIAGAAAGGRVTGLDFSEPMLERARRKAPSLEWIQGDVLELPFEDASFDAATVGFGVRNVDDLQRALVELRRVLRPGGRLGILEITRPRGVLAPFYRFWFDRVVPLLGKLLPGGSAYTYLPASVRRFPGPEELAELIAAAGFREVRFRLFAGSIVALHTAEAV